MWPFRKRLRDDRLDEAVRRYADRELPRLLGMATPAEPPAIGSFPRGRGTYVRHVELAGYGKVVLRVYFRRSHLQALAGAAALDKLLAPHGLPFPRLLAVDDSRSALRRYGFQATVEPFIDGELFMDVAADAQEALTFGVADTLARLHRIESSDAGRPWRGEAWRPEERERESLLGWLMRARRLAPTMPEAPLREVADWGGQQVAALPHGPHRFMHGDVNVTNVLRGADGTLWLLDLGEAAFWFPQVDLVASEITLCAESPARIAAFRERYFAAAGDGVLTLDAYEAARPCFAARHHVRTATSRARRAARARKAGMSDWREWADSAAEHWQKARAYLAQAGGPDPGPLAETGS
jgi:aminoglycoside phosphotransferase (APT) family kinase protein